MMNEINIKYMSDETLETLRRNLDKYEDLFIEQPTKSDWIYEISTSNTYIEKYYKINDFKLKLPSDIKDKKTELDNAITLYTHLKDLPMVVLVDERFWNWINFEKGYEAALKMMPIKRGSSVVQDHWLFSKGKRRGIFFGVLSRIFFRVHLTVDEGLSDPYELTKFAFHNPERIRNMTWRTYSNNKKVVQGALRGEMKLLNEIELKVEKSNYYTEIAKHLSKMGILKLLDTMSEEEICDSVYNKFIELLIEDEMI